MYEYEEMCRKNKCYMERDGRKGKENCGGGVVESVKKKFVAVQRKSVA